MPKRIDKISPDEFRQILERHSEEYRETTQTDGSIKFETDCYKNPDHKKNMIVVFRARMGGVWEQKVSCNHNSCKGNVSFAGFLRHLDPNFLKDTTFEKSSKTQTIPERELPEIVNFGELADLPPLSPELIEGVLREGHKMLIAGQSKAGKSFLLINLAVALAEGESWLGFKCNPGRVLILNLEVDDASYLNRIDKVTKALGCPKPQLLDVWNLRGMCTSIDELTPQLIERAQNKGYSAIILDPLYKLNQGDENSASEMGKFFNQLDQICTELHTSIICCHHHSKGAQGGKFAIDRASGSGVFARDPDAFLDMIRIDPADVGKSLENGQTAWRISFTLREFRSPDDIDVIFDWPLHKVTQDLKDAKPMSGAGASTNSQRGNHEKKRKADKKYQRLCEFVANWDQIDTGVSHLPHPTVKDAVDYFKSDKGYSPRTIRNWLEDRDELKLENGLIVPVDNDEE